MPRRKAAPIALLAQEREVLDRIARDDAARQAMAARARIVLLAAEGLSNREISGRVALEEHCIGRWRRRFVRDRLWGLFDQRRPERPSNER